MPLPQKSLIKKIKRASLSGDDDLLSQLIWQAFSKANENTKVKLDNQADLTSLIPVAFFAIGLIEFVRRPVAPKWFDWWWFSYSIFRDLNMEKRRIPHFHSENSKE